MTEVMAFNANAALRSIAFGKHDSDLVTIE